ncbi:MAG: TldD/PmbA family protein [Bacteroidales bacterium]|jgi:PmbA protein|nr:TldD/PmbA family protein [Bacteroidales bacterium]OQB63715.1 MAG: peptidase PmbA [Bacteroidetes bacterium ADurb.Bin145]HOU01330.1 TldD/PmbA family protein [Bacteroidales bacterium]HQK67413.1 TldD/PmbA family protein [Bacteroidales bacterium]
MDTNEKNKIADLVIKHALKCGADQVAMAINDNSTRRIEIREQKIDRLQESIGNSLSVDLYVNKKFSSHSTNLLKEKEIMKFIEEAVEATKYLAEDEFRYLPEKELYYQGKGEDLKTLDPAITTIDSKTKIDLARAVESEIFGSDERIISITSTYFDNVSKVLLADSNGFRGESDSSTAALAAEVSVKGETGRPADYWAEYSIFFDKLIKTGIGKKALQRTLRKLNPRKIESGKYKLLVDNTVSGNLISPFISALFGTNLYQKNSFLDGMTDKRVASDLLSFSDDPLIVSGFGSRCFDMEGLNAIKRPIVEDGVLRNYFINTYYGRKLKLQPTSGSTSNLIYKTGSRNPDELIKTIDKGILVTGFNGGNCNGATGDFSYGIEGFFIKNGEVVHPVNEMNITGNMKEFWNTLIETGNDPYPYSTNQIPSLLFENADVSGI